MAKILNFEQTCYACPSQWEGYTKDGERLYIRYRYGFLRMTLDNKEIYSAQHGDGWDGLISEKKVRKILKELDYTIKE